MTLLLRWQGRSVSAEKKNSNCNRHFSHVFLFSFLCSILSGNQGEVGCLFWRSSSWWPWESATFRLRKAGSARLARVLFWCGWNHLVEYFLEGQCVEVEKKPSPLFSLSNGAVVVAVAVCLCCLLCFKNVLRCGCVSWQKMNSDQNEAQSKSVCPMPSTFWILVWGSVLCWIIFLLKSKIRKQKFIWFY